MINFNNSDFRIAEVEESFKRFKTAKREIVLNVYGASDRDTHEKYAIYVTGYKDLDKLKGHLKGKGFTVYGSGVGVYKNSKDISVGFNKSIRTHDVNLCAKIVWVIHATA